MGYQLLGREPVTVPFLDEGYHYVPFGVIVKKHKRVILQTSGSRPECIALCHNQICLNLLCITQCAATLSLHILP